MRIPSDPNADSPYPIAPGSAESLRHTMPDPRSFASEEGGTLAEVLEVFHGLFAEGGRGTGVRLVGGFPEPFYRAPGPAGGAEIRFTRDYLNSCLHEAAHWCIAGPARRALDDYGYWYRPDGRNGSEQSEFFQAEAAPQALEWAFALACGARFRASLDNLGGSADGLAEFGAVLEGKLRSYLAAGFPPRADRFLRGLMARFHPETADGRMAAWLAERMDPLQRPCG